MLIHVTSEHIKNGQKGSLFACPIALAIKKKCYDVQVSAGSLWVKKQPDGYFTNMHFPKAVKAFVRKFDCGEEVAPFSFTLRAKKEG